MPADCLLIGVCGVHAQGEAPSKDARQEGANALVELEEAYSVLHNARTREKYDRLGYDGASLSLQGDSASLRDACEPKTLSQAHIA